MAEQEKEGRKGSKCMREGRRKGERGAQTRKEMSRDGDMAALLPQCPLCMQWNSGV